ncbi:MAG: multicomponent Na+:H+ antiporter subunit [Thermosediminibacterales bacterium]|nr:multicomponent Na+:H+ antiporter subunit [Thermosediminibacterales bacterium]
MILKHVTVIVVPFIQMYGLYVVYNGHLSPGGGFAGGTILAASLILLCLTFGVKKVSERISYKIVRFVQGFGLLWYGFIKILGLFQGKHLIPDSFMKFMLGTPGNLFSSGLIFLANLGLGFTVAATMFILFSCFMGEDQ